MKRLDLGNMWSLEPEPLDPGLAERMEALIQRIAAEAVRRRLATVAVLALESGKPLSFLGSQALVFLEPLVRTFLDPPDDELFVKLLEDRSRVERLVEVLEDLEDARLEQDPG